jgi:DNA-directed RNA polymerase subunit RPC12/RpoP
MNTTTQPGPSWMRLSCRIWGHVVDNHVFRSTRGDRRRCRCGVDYLPKTGETTHVRHTLSCFIRHHTYVRLTDRDGVHEYVCVRCGHPLAYPAAADPFANASLFAKKVRYACGLLGHRVTVIANRHGFVEYACHCGHSFLKHAADKRKIRHPLICFLTAHRIRFVEERAGYAEYVCEDCGHPFCFVADERVAERPSIGRTPACAGPSEPSTRTPGTASAASSA